MRIEYILKSTLGIVLISFFIVMGQELRTDNFIVNILLVMPQWIAIFIFFDWAKWVTYENYEMNEKKKAKIGVKE